jgi:1-acyl-sn-glycerol-3-phosphate acyltransferase
VKAKRLLRPAYGEPLGAAWTVVWAILYGPASLLIRTRYRNLERLPRDGAAILVTNHVSHVDPFLVAKMLLDGGRTPRFLAKDTIFDVKVVGAAMRGMGHIPVKRGTADARQSLSGAVQALADGKILTLHPEGTVTRDPDGWPMTGKTGAARLALLAPDVTVIPVAQWGVQQSVDLYKKRVKLLPRPRHVISIGAPIDLSAYYGHEATPAVLHEMTDTIMRRLRSDVAELRGVPAPTGPLYHWVRPGTHSGDGGDHSGDDNGDNSGGHSGGHSGGQDAA